MTAYNFVTAHTQRTHTAKFDLVCKILALLLSFVIPISPVATHVVIIALLFCWIMAGDLQKKLNLIWKHPVARIATLFYAIYIAGSFYSFGTQKDILQQLNKMSKLLCIPLLIPIMIDKKWRRLAIWAFVAAMLLTLILSILKVHAGLPIANRYTAACVFRDHIYTNLMMAFASFIVGHYWLASTNHFHRLILFVLLSGLIFYVLFMSDGRSGYIIFGILWALLCLQRLKFKGLAIGLVSLTLLFSFALTSSTRFQERTLAAIKNFEQYQGGDANSSLGARLQYLYETWQLSKQRLLFGFGTGSFKQIYQNHAMSHDLLVTHNPHNEYLNVLLQLGIVGLIGLLFLFWTILKYSFYLPPPEKWFAQGLLAAMMVGCIANSWLMDFTSGYFFVTLIAFCFGSLNLKGYHG